MTRFYNQRNQKLWNHTSKQQEAWLIGYLLASDPGQDESLPLLDGAFQAGLDVLELGVPSQNPFLDGDVIQRGHKRVLDQDLQGDWLFDLLGKVRKKVEKPIWAMGYQAELLSRGFYLQLAANGLIDGFVLPDCDQRGLRKIENEVIPYGVDVIRLVHQDMTDQEIATICQGATIVYAQSYPGKTGKIGARLAETRGFYQRIRAYTDALIILGFGIRTPQMVKQVFANGFQGAVVGSVLVELVEKRQYDDLYQLISRMKQQTFAREKG